MAAARSEAIAAREVQASVPPRRSPHALAARRGMLDLARDLVTLTKPRITLVVLITAAGGMKLAQAQLHRATGLAAPITGMVWLYAMLGTALIVGSANVLNMYWERDVDGLMDRTRNRPLPAGRMNPTLALWFGIGIGAGCALPFLWP